MSADIKQSGAIETTTGVNVGTGPRADWPLVHFTEAGMACCFRSLRVLRPPGV